MRKGKKVKRIDHPEKIPRKRAIPAPDIFTPKKVDKPLEVERPREEETNVGSA